MKKQTRSKEADGDFSAATTGQGLAPEPVDAGEFDTDIHARGGIQALDAALTVLHSLANSEGAMTLTDLAKSVSMPASKVHRYLASFMHAGFVRQPSRSGRYDLGPVSASLGIAALGRQDITNQAANDLPELGERTGLTALLSVWGSHGATVVQWCRAASPVVTSFGLGSTMPLLTSASGQIFLAFLPVALTAERLESERSRASDAEAALAGLDISAEGISALISHIRSQGFSSIDGRFIPGLRAISAPVLNWQGEVEAAVTLIGASDRILAPNGKAVEELLQFTQRLSAGSVWPSSQGAHPYRENNLG